jgi:hypothetical protein
LYTLEVTDTAVSNKSGSEDSTSGGTTANPSGGTTGGSNTDPGTTTTPSPGSNSGNQADIKENEKKLKDAAASDQKSIVFETKDNGNGAGVDFSFDSVEKAIKDSKDKTIVIKNGNITFELPNNLKELIQNSGSTFDLTNSTLTVKINKVDKALDEQIQNKASSLGFKLLDTPVNYQLNLKSGDKTEEIKNFGNTYVSRTIELDGVIDGDTTTAIVFNPDTGEFRYVPALFTVVNGKTIITIKSTTNSIYTVAQFDKSFNDIQTHWAKTQIELLSSKLIVNGTTSSTFAPNEKITRAEFAALLVRALGLTSNGTSISFKDVAATDWYAASAQIAAQFKLITGYEDGTFKPNQIISREQMSVMAARALQFSNQKASPTAVGDLNHFGDVKEISSWAQEAAGQMIANGIIQGKTEVLFAPQDTATRAEATVILTRLLQSLNLINK